MSIKNDINFDSQCRVCLCSNLTMYPLFSENKYSIKLSECSNVAVAIDDGFPNSICEKCLDDLPIAYDFVMKCRESDQKLRQFSNDRKLQKNVLNIEYDIDIIETKIKQDPDILPVNVEIIKYDNSLDDTKDFLEHNTDYTDPIGGINDEEYDEKPIRKNRLYKNIKGHRIKKEPQFKKIRKITIPSAPKPLLQCPVCDYKATVPSLMVVHSRRHTGDKPFVCDFCKRAFSLKGTLKQHIVRCHLSKGKNVICEVCGQGFYNARDANTHMRVHTKETPYHCHLCPKSFSQQSSLITHVRTHTGEKPFPCKICGKRFISTSMLNKHNQVHSKERPYVCSICGVAVKCKSTLVQHQLTHQGVKSYVCDQCGMAFLKKGGLKLHTMTVHSEKSGQCSVCNKQFSNLENHMRAHTGETPFQCHVCSKSYSRQQSLAIHMTKHENSGKFPCTVDDCKKKFRYKSMLEFHILKYHKNHTPHVCDECGRGFFRLSDLSRHQTLNHGYKNKKPVPKTEKEK